MQDLSSRVQKGKLSKKSQKILEAAGAEGARLRKGAYLSFEKLSYLSKARYRGSERNYKFFKRSQAMSNRE